MEVIGLQATFVIGVSDIKISQSAKDSFLIYIQVSHCFVYHGATHALFQISRLSYKIYWFRHYFILNC